MLETCPRCGYSLRGLPAEYRCPECGLAYDAESEMFKLRSPWALLGVIVAVGFGGACFVSLLVHSTGVVVGDSVPVIYMVVYGLVSFRLGWRYWRNYRHGMMVASMPDALWLTLGVNDDERIAWGDISRVVLGRGFLGATLYLRGSKSVRDIKGVFRKRTDAKRFVVHVEARIANFKMKPPCV